MSRRVLRFNVRFNIDLMKGWGRGYTQRTNTREI